MGGVREMEFDLEVEQPFVHVWATIDGMRRELKPAVYVAVERDETPAAWSLRALAHVAAMVEMMIENMAKEMHRA